MINEHENRRFIIFNCEELSLIDFSKVYETSAETVRKSIDETLTFVEYDLPAPQCVLNLETKTEPLTIEQLLLILDTNEWQHEHTDLEI